MAALTGFLEAVKILATILAALLLIAGFLWFISTDFFAFIATIFVSIAATVAGIAIIVKWQSSGLAWLVGLAVVGLGAAGALIWLYFGLIAVDITQRTENAPHVDILIPL